MREFLWQRLPAVRSAERSRFVFFFLLSAGLSLAGTLGLVGSEALFLTRVGPSELPAAFVLASLTTLVASVAYASVVGRARNDRLFGVLLLGGAAILWGILNRAEAGQASAWIALFCAFYVFQAVFINLHFWTFATDFFDTLASKRLFPLLAVGSSLGGMLGGGCALALSQWLPAQSLISAWALTLALGGVALLAARTRLLRWRVLDSAEADESSAEGMRGALRYMTRSPLARWLGVSVVGMVVALTVMQYLYLDIFARSFEDTRELAGFLGLYLAVTNAIEIGVASGFTPWVLRKLGVARANLLHPALTLLSFVALALDPRLWAAMLARANRELFENGLAGPVRALFYNALPMRFRGRMRALLEGVFFFAAMSIAGAGLLGLSDRLGDTRLAVVGGGAALIYAASNWLVRRKYLQSLVAELRRGRFDADEMADSVDSRLLATLAEPWEDALSDPGARYGTALLDLAEPLATGGHADRVRRQLAHPRTAVRAACLRALVKAGADDSKTLLAHALADADPAMRRTATELADAGAGPAGPELQAALRARLDDSDIGVRAEAARLLGPEGEETLRSLLRASSPEARKAALESAPDSLLAGIRENLSPRETGVRAGAIQALVRLGATDSLPLAELIDDIRSLDPDLRRAAAAALASRSEDAALHALAQALDDDVQSVRTRAQRALANLGDRGLRAAEPLCHHSTLTTAEAGLETVARAGGASAEYVLAEQYGIRVREAWNSRLALARLDDAGPVELRFLRAALRNAESRGRALALAALERSERRDVVRSVVRVLDRASVRARGDALEVLCNLGPRAVSAQLALLLEDGPLEEALPHLEGFVDPPRDLTDVIRAAADSSDPWLQMAANRYGERQQGPGPVPDMAAASFEALRQREAETMERLLALQQVPLFSRLSLDQLQRIDNLMREEQFLAGETVVREGEVGDHLYILMEGALAFYKGWQTPEERRLGQLEPVGCMGEIALLDDEPRSVTAVATQDCLFLTLAGQRFKELLLQSPEMGSELFRVLTARIRAAENRSTPGMDAH